MSSPAARGSASVPTTSPAPEVTVARGSVSSPTWPSRCCPAEALDARWGPRADKAASPREGANTDKATGLREDANADKPASAMTPTPAPGPTPIPVSADPAADRAKALSVEPEAR